MTFRAPEDPVPGVAGARVLDLGHPLSSADPSWAGVRTFSRVTLETIEHGGCFTGRITTDEHFGTHVDAPAHFAAGGLTIDQLPPERLVRPAVCVNVERQSTEDEDYRLTREDLERFERTHGPIVPNTVVLVATGWDRRWPDEARYRNVRDGMMHFPGLSKEAAALLARDRRVAGIGIDSPSVDHGPTRLFEVHRLTQPLGVYHIENLTGLTALPPAGFTVVVAPIRIVGGSGGPARVFAILP